jgi:hypothetical protein
MQSTSTFTYADDLVIIARLLNIVIEYHQNKCASISMTRNKRYRDNIEFNDFRVQGKVIPSLKEHEHYRYLGVPIGVIRDIDCLDTLIDDLCKDLDRIRDSLLAPWQKLDAIRTFVQPCLTYALRADDLLKTNPSLIKYRKKLIEIVRSILNLPTRACNAIVFASKKVGGLGLQDPIAELDVQTVVQAIKMLSSSDPFVAAVAQGELLKAVRFAARKDPSPALI